MGLEHFLQIKDRTGTVCCVRGRVLRIHATSLLPSNRTFHVWGRRLVNFSCPVSINCWLRFFCRRKIELYDISLWPTWKVQLLLSGKLYLFYFSCLKEFELLNIHLLFLSMSVFLAFKQWILLTVKRKRALKWSKVSTEKLLVTVLSLRSEKFETRQLSVGYFYSTFIQAFLMTKDSSVCRLRNFIWLQRKYIND